ncbi:uncharacterized protein CIMG_11941 [Coccidioides immitis RS]|uniref:Uncharacterized protein n=4 Tax=Coccidioides immitis TaxID=5501 RepID=A0A0D8JTM9_COCIM|nr:uncharacterized protein CIMG_11941 [Coccidioides immitis RS]KJF60690.1 hypothetical protein CIMG_11941 [Coccidioides immitis RS]KMP02440.1 hypothetical protein CIRG_10263 [Coccidioides immitis RMSCC 2394]KMU76708.1 hypothetical protein CISG_05851 [Coccidioides immitis RMSCC 3703]KMU88781.1 hypothetical protein CIHG_06449 [Coccidioides immitis H538.4]
MMKDDQLPNDVMIFAASRDKSFSSTEYSPSKSPRRFGGTSREALPRCQPISWPARWLRDIPGPQYGVITEHICPVGSNVPVTKYVCMGTGIQLREPKKVCGRGVLAVDGIIVVWIAFSGRPEVLEA